MRIENPKILDDSPTHGILTDYPSIQEAQGGGLASSSCFKRLWWAIKQTKIYTPKIAVLSASSQIETRRYDHESFRRRISLLEEAGVKSFLILGEEIYNDLFRDVYSESFSKMRGSYLKHPEFPRSLFLPTYHPRVLNSKRYKNKGAQADLSLVALYDVQRWVEGGFSGFSLPAERFNIEPGIEEVEAFAVKAIENDLLLSLDIETTSLRRDRGNIVVLGAAWSEEDAIVIPFLNGRKGSYFGPQEHYRMKKAVNDILQNCRQLWQNALFDVPFMRHHGFDVNMDKVIHDTMLGHHALSPELPHDLGFINSCYGKTRYWKDDFLKRGVGILDMDQLQMRQYNARDCVVPLQILPGLLQDIEDNNCTDAYNENISCLRAAVEQTETGILIDQPQLKKLEKSLKERRKLLEQRLRTLGKLPSSFNFNSSRHLAWFLFYENQGMLEKLEELEVAFRPKTLELFLCEKNHKRWIEEGCEDKKPCRYCGSEVFTKTDEKKTKEKQRTNPRTGKLTGDAVDYDKLKEIASIRPIIVGRFFGKRNRDTNALLMDKGARAALHGRVIEEILHIKNLKRTNDRHHKDLRKLQKLSLWLRFFDLYQKTQKSISTYTSFPIWQDGRVHTNILLHGTASGRPASRGPSLLNISKKDKGIRKCFVLPPKKKLIALDYAAIEARMLAFITQDPLFIEAVLAGNLHDINTKTLFHIDETDRYWSAGRAAAKIFQFAFIQYGGTERSTWEKVCLAAPKLGLSLKDFRAASMRYFDHFNRFAEWREEVKDIALRERITVSPFGRIRYLYGSENSRVRQAYNHPPQSGAAHVMNTVMVESLKARDAAGMQAKLQLQIYDDLRWETPAEEVKKLIKLVVPIMEQEFVIGDVVRSFPVDIEIGTSWGDLKEVNRKEFL